MVSRPFIAAALSLAASLAGAATDLVIATVDNDLMIEMQRQSRRFESANPDIKLQWVTLPEGVLRQRLTTDITTKAGQFDVMTIGLYETPIWGRRGWLRPLDPPADYEADDLMPFVRDGLSIDGRLYAAPFYGESSMLMYRRDLLTAAGLDMPNRPTWAHVRQLAQRLHDPARGVYGICLRGKPGWGDNMALVTTMVNSYEGQWFDMAWRPQLDSEPWRQALAMYLDLLGHFGPPDAHRLSFNELQALFAAGHCAMWVDATVGAAAITDPKRSVVSRKVSFAQAPSGTTSTGANWLWAWSLAVPATSRQPEAARRFVLWATSKAYVQLVARESGWGRVPTGTRQSTYASLDFLAASPAAAIELQALHSANFKAPTRPPSPYSGIQFVAIPEFQAIGNMVGSLIATALQGRGTIDEALVAGQEATVRASAAKHAASPASAVR